MDIVTIKNALDWFLIWTCVFALAALAVAFALFYVRFLFAKLKAAAMRYGWPLVILFIACSAWATYTAFPTAEEKNESRGNVAIYLRHPPSRGALLRTGGYGGQDVIMLPMVNTNSQLGNGEWGTVKREQGRGNGEEGTGNGNIGNTQQENTFIRASLTQEDFARGFVLTRIGTNELHDFTSPLGASICEDWKAFGAAEDWIYLREEGNGKWEEGNVGDLRVHSDGWVEALSPTSMVFAAREYYPFKTTLGIVPKANWERVVFNAEAQSCRETQSCFWCFSTPSNSLQLTWQNVLYNREVDLPISFQVEFLENGDFIYYYDLSSIKSKIDSGLVPNNFPSNITIGTTPSSLIPNSSSLFPYLSPP
jgi:hypothetical protein